MLSRGDEPSAVVPEDAAELCGQFYFRPAAVLELEGYADANFRVDNAAGERFVLKIGEAARDRLPIEFEQLILEHLAARDWPGVPRHVPSYRQRSVERITLAGREIDVRLLTWLDGVPMARLPKVSASLLGDLGRFLARLDIALAAARPSRERVFDWDLAQLASRRPPVDLIAAVADRRLVEESINGFVDRRTELLAGLPRSMIHCDANDHNIVVTSEDPTEARLVGLIDFGDLVVTETIYELAIAATYVGLEHEDPWAAALPLVVAYDSARPLLSGERRILLAAIRARLALSVSMAAKRRHGGTADAYALVSERGAWEALRRLSGLDEATAERSLAAALGPATSA